MFQLRNILYMSDKNISIEHAMKNLEPRHVTLLGIATDYNKILDENSKLCNKCQTEQPLSNFSKGGFDRDGNARFRPSCKDCSREIQKTYGSRTKEYQKNQHEKLKDWKKAYYQENKGWIKEWQQDWYKENKTDLNHKHKIYRDNNPEKERLRHAKHYQENKGKIHEYRRRFYREHPEKKLISSCSARVRNLLNGSGTLNNARYIGCNAEFLLEWFEFQLGFSHDMVFDNYGTYWHIDHVIPCSKWNLDEEEHKERCFHWTNLSPLQAKLNISKNDNIDPELINEQNKEIEQFSKIKNEEYNSLQLLN